MTVDRLARYRSAGRCDAGKQSPVVKKKPHRLLSARLFAVLISMSIVRVCGLGLPEFSVLPEQNAEKTAALNRVALPQAAGL